MEKILMLKNPPLKGPGVIWGDGRLAKRYGLEVEEGCDINRQPMGGGFGGNCIIQNGEFAGQTVEWLWTNHRDYFGHGDEVKDWDYLPIGMGACWASADLSVQVHPREDWALKNLGRHGKSECWYFPECEPENNTVVFGCNANSLEELDEYIARGDFEGLIKRHPIHPGSFYAIRGGTLHAVQKGSYFIETCNPTEITYRFYDYNRVDKDGKPRELNIEKARENIIVPDQPVIYDEIHTDYDGVHERFMADNDMYAVWLYKVDGKGTVPTKKPYQGCFVINGEGSVNGMPLKAGQVFMVTSDCTELTFEGKMEIINCHN